MHKLRFRDEIIIKKIATVEEVVFNNQVPYSPLRMLKDTGDPAVRGSRTKIGGVKKGRRILMRVGVEETNK